MSKAYSNHKKTYFMYNIKKDVTIAALSTHCGSNHLRPTTN